MATTNLNGPSNHETSTPWSVAEATEADRPPEVSDAQPTEVDAEAMGERVDPERWRVWVLENGFGFGKCKNWDENP